MKRIVRLTESDLTRIVRRVISEQAQWQNYFDQVGEYTYGKNQLKFTKKGGSIEGLFDCTTNKITKMDGAEVFFPESIFPKEAKMALINYCKTSRNNF